jgi:hypothetical protein
LTFRGRRRRRRHRRGAALQLTAACRNLLRAKRSKGEQKERYFLLESDAGQSARRLCISILHLHTSLPFTTPYGILPLAPRAPRAPLAPLALSLHPVFWLLLVHLHSWPNSPSSSQKTAFALALALGTTHPPLTTHHPLPTSLTPTTLFPHIHPTPPTPSRSQPLCAPVP